MSVEKAEREGRQKYYYAAWRSKECSCIMHTASLQHGLQSSCIHGGGLEDFPMMAITVAECIHRCV